MLAADAAVAIAAPAATILIVDDEPQNRRLLEIMLRRDGYVALAVANGEEALAAIAQRAPDLILLDIKLPGIDGYQVARALKGDPGTSNIPIIMVTVLVDRDARMSALKVGVEELVTKPIDPAELSLRVRNLLRLKAYGDLLQDHGVNLEQQVLARTADLRKSEQRLRTIFETSPECMKLVTEDMVVLDMNPAGLAMLEAESLAEVQARPLLDFIVPEYRAAFSDLHARVMRGESGIAEFQVIGLKGGRRWLETHAALLDGKNGKSANLLGVTRDITVRKAAEARIIRLNRVYAVLSGINSAIVRIRARDELLREACRIAVSEGGYVLARVIEVDANGKARIATSTESDNRLFQNIVDDYNRDPEHSSSMLQLALHGRQTLFSNDVAGDPRIPNRVALTQGGNYALAVLPIHAGKRFVGALILRAQAADAFDKEEKHLLLELTGNISLALEHFDQEERLGTLASGQERDQEELRRFGVAMDATADAIYLVDRSSMRFVHVNGAACRMQRRSREELLALGPAELLGISRTELEHSYDAIIASGVDAEPLEMLRTRKDGSQVWVELRRHAQRSGDRWTIVTLVRDVTQRKEAEVRIRRLNRVYAVLSGINTLIVRVSDREELFREACRIAVEHGGFRMAWIGIVDRARMELLPVASAGSTQDYRELVNQRFSLLDDAPRGNALGARSIREKTAIFSNDVRKDPRVVFKDEHAARGSRSMVILPLQVSGEVTGLLTLYSGEAGFFDGEEIKLLNELAGDIAFAVDHIDRAAKLARITRVNAMLSGINGAIVRIRGRQELFEEACRIALETGGMSFAWVGLADASGKRLRMVASAGRDDGFLQAIRDRLALLDAAPEAQGLSTRALREGRVVVVNDVAADAVTGRRKAFADRGIKAVAILPFFIAGRAVGTFALHSEQAGFFDGDEMRLLNEMAANIAFALEHLEKEEKVRRLTRVYAVLSGINTLIVRVSNREELFSEACRIAVEVGQFSKAWLGTVDPDSKRFTIVAAHGGDPSFFRSLENEVGVKVKEGRGLVMRAIDTRQPVIVNDAASDPDVLLKDDVTASGVRSLAMLPLIVSGEVAAVFALNADVVGYFDDEEMKLLVELAGDIGFALDHIGKKAKLDYLAYYDALTGLANRTLFLERVALHMRSAVAGGHKLALFFLDLERFRNINDSLGRPAGDALLKQVAEWLVLNVGDRNLLARLGGDHFGIVLPEVAPDGDVAQLLDKRLRAFLDHPFRVNDTEIPIAGRVGVALFPTDGTDADTLLRNAEAALKKTKGSGDRYLFYAQTMTEASAGKLTLENQLRAALNKDEFVLHYQPKMDLYTGKLASAEALIRWNDPRTGLVPPGRFIPILEETGLIYDVGRWALRKAVADYLRWRAAGLPAVRVAVNVSPLQLRNRGFIDDIREVIGIHAHAAAGLELEITESLIMEDVKNTIASLQAIRAMGVTIAIDDFGTGFSSLSYLAKLPVDTLKIDRSFVIDMTTGPEGLALVSTIISLAHSLRLKVVAEGVETEEQSHLLRLLKCDEMQGFLVSKPMPAESFETGFLIPPAAIRAGSVT